MGGDKMGFQPRGEPTICGGPIVWTTPSPPEGTKAWKIGRLAKGAPRVTGNNGCGPAGAGRLTPRRRWRQFIGQLFRMDDAPSAEAPAGGGQIGGGDASAVAGIAYKIRLAVPHVLIFSTTILYSFAWGRWSFQRLERPYETKMEVNWRVENGFLREIWCLGLDVQHPK
uniref:Uncharacterized protein n=1 Tax=Globodera pallida TaxID=36090 RepID=A0A183BVK5_GLOPA